jgi:hypothetical protein
MDGNKLVVETTMPNGTEWHDEWVVAPDGKTYSALRVMAKAGVGGAFGKAGGAPKGGDAPKGGGAPKAGGAPKGGAAKGPAGPPEPETFTKIN